MAQPQFGQADYANAIEALLPRGRVWPRDPASVQSQAVAGFAGTPTRLDAAAMQLIEDGFPSTAVALLPEWEESLGLPDPCAGPEPTIALRQAQVTARFAGLGGQSVAFYTGFAATLGFDITITEFTGSLTLANTWQVNVPGSNITYFLCDESYIDDTIDLVASDAAVLVCEFARLKPAHTILNWNFI